MIECIWDQLLGDFSQYFFVDVPSRESCFEPRLWILVQWVVAQILSFAILVVFIISCPDHNRWVVPQRFHVCGCFSLYKVEKSVMSRIVPVQEFGVSSSALG